MSIHRAWDSDFLWQKNRCWCCKSYRWLEDKASSLSLGLWKSVSPAIISCDWGSGKRQRLQSQLPKVGRCWGYWPRLGLVRDQCPTSSGRGWQAHISRHHELSHVPHIQKSTHLAFYSCQSVLKPGKTATGVGYHPSQTYAWRVTDDSCLLPVTGQYTPLCFHEFDLTSFKCPLGLEVWVSPPCWMFCPVENRIQHKALTQNMLARKFLL